MNMFAMAKKAMFTLLVGAVPIMGRCLIEPDSSGTVRLPVGGMHITIMAFEGCIRLKKVIIPREIQELPKKIFKQCTELREVIFEDGSTLKFIARQAFDKTYKLKTISLPQSLTLIGDRAFFESGVEEVVFKGAPRKLRFDLWAFYKSSLKSIDLPWDASLKTDAFSQTGCSDDSIFVPGATIKDCNPNMVRVHKKIYWSSGNFYHNDIFVSFKVGPGNSQNPFIGIYPPNTVSNNIRFYHEPLRKILFKKGTIAGTGNIPIYPALEGKENYEAYLLTEDYYYLAGPSVFTIQDQKKHDDPDDDW